MPRYPDDRRGKNEKLEHYLNRLQSARQSFLKTTPERQLSKFVTEFRWTYFATFEFNMPFISRSAAESIFRSYLNRHRYSYAYYTVEFSPMLHIHALIHTSELEPWQYGVSEVRPVTKQNNAAYYIKQKAWRAEWNFHGAEWMKLFRGVHASRPAHTNQRQEIIELQQSFLARLRRN